MFFFLLLVSFALMVVALIKAGNRFQDVSTTATDLVTPVIDNVQ